MSPETYRALRAVLEPETGHWPQRLPASVELVLEGAAARRGANPAALVERIRLGIEPELKQSVLNALTVSYTRLFRHPEHFEYLGRVALPEFRRGSTGPIRIWSAGCATGEEPYSIAWVADQHAHHVEIVATDVDQQSLDVAERGSYALSEANPSFGFPGGTWTVPDRLKKMIRFVRGSLAGNNPHGSRGPFDIIFCRNVLIYFDESQVNTIVRTLTRSIRGEGALVVAPVESVVRVRVRAQNDAPLGWMRHRDVLEAIGRPRLPLTPATPLTSTLPVVRPEVRPEPQRAATFGVTASKRAEDAPPALDESRVALLTQAARELGERKFEDAEQTLRELLGMDPDDPEGWFLLGEALFGRGERHQASFAFRRVSRCCAGRDGTSSSRDEEDLLTIAAERRASMCV